MSTDTMIRKVLDENGRMRADVAKLDRDDNLYDAGMTSHASVNVMLALEDEFEVEFPDKLLRRDTFASISAIADALGQLQD